MASDEIQNQLLRKNPVVQTQGNRKTHDHTSDKIRLTRNEQIATPETGSAATYVSYSISLKMCKFTPQPSRIALAATLRATCSIRLRLTKPEGLGPMGDDQEREHRAGI
jgi:2C-methyl-D-erythritol 2,4-cyclodiphosphate synthase